MALNVSRYGSEARSEGSSNITTLVRRWNWSAVSLRNDLPAPPVGSSWLGPARSRRPRPEKVRARKMAPVVVSLRAISPRPRGRDRDVLGGIIVRQLDRRIHVGNEDKGRVFQCGGERLRALGELGTACQAPSPRRRGFSASRSRGSTGCRVHARTEPGDRPRSISDSPCCRR